MLRKILSLLLFACTIAVSAKDYVFKEGVNTVDSYTPADAVFTATQDGKVLIEAQEVWKIMYAGVEATYSYAPGSDYAFKYEINDVKAGADITLSNGFPMSSRLRITMYGNGPVPVQVTNVYPKQGNKFDWNNTGMVSVNFNKVVTISSIKFMSGDYSADVDDVHLGSSMGFNITNALNAGLNEGKMNPGDRFQIVIKGLRDAADKSNLYNGDGNLTLEYIAPHAQHNFVSATVGGTPLSYLQANDYKFLSYYASDSEDGLFVFEFDGEVGKVGGVVMSMGNLDLDAQGKYHRSSLPYTIQGNKLLVDARGKLRTLAVLFPAVIENEAEEGTEVNEGLGAYDKEHVTISLQNVMDVNGNAFRCQQQGSVGSYSFVMNYEEIIDEAYIDGDNKADGDPVKSGEDISLWVSNSGIRFDGIEVSYFVDLAVDDEIGSVRERRSVIVTDFTATPDPLEGIIVTFTMPEMKDVATGSAVRVALHNANSADGMPHYLYIDFVAAGTEDAIGGIAGMPKSGKVYRLNGTKAQGNKPAGIYLKSGRKYVQR